MAENTYKKKNEREKETKRFSFRAFFVKNRRVQIVLGCFLMFSSFFLIISFISYLSHCKNDQSIVESFFTSNIIESGKEIENYFGLLGALSSHALIFLSFGLGAFFIPPLIFVLAYRLLFFNKLFDLEKILPAILFHMVWLSIFLSYFIDETISIMDFIAGNLGYQCLLYISSLLGSAAIYFIILLFITFNIYHFNITSLAIFDGIKVLDFVKNVPSAVNWKRKELTDKLTSFIKKSDSIDPEEISSLANNLEITNNLKKENNENNNGEENSTEAIEGEENNEKIKFLVDRPAKKEVVLQIEDNTSTDESDTGLETEEDKTNNNALEEYNPKLDIPNYQYPTHDLLNQYPEKEVEVYQSELEQNKDRIVETLVSFKIEISSIKATVGPTVTLYEIVPESGIKISKIKNLEDDIALSLSALGIRIIAPIPGKGTIGIEVPNKNRQMVDARSVITSLKFTESKHQLPVALGKTISNEVFVTDLSKMPHLLMAGATGQGKSVGLNIMLTSLLYKKHPSELKFVMVDPKKVELSLFNKIEKHFLAMLPDGEEAIITDTKKVVNTLNSLCIEMDNRYDLLKNAGCRNIKEYNKKFVQRKLIPTNGHRYLPYIVLVIDELADLMMTAGKEIEAPIARLAQLARAIGIHLIVATQRPSVNVITGVIKANFPARLSFRVTSKIDSRTILDAGGADQLIGMGDMLLSIGSEITRLQCAFVDTPEVDRICQFISNQQGYSSAFLLPEYVTEENASLDTLDMSEKDVLFGEAARLVVRHQQGSTSLIQRKLKLGYNRAGRLIDQLELAGIVGPFEGSKAREVLVAAEYGLEQLLTELDKHK